MSTLSTPMNIPWTSGKHSRDLASSCPSSSTLAQLLPPLPGPPHAASLLKNTLLLPKFTQKYSLSHEIGSGATGFVMAANNFLENIPCVVKFILKDRIPITHWKRDRQVGTLPSELFFLRKLTHTNIIKCIEFFEDNRFYYLVMEQHGHDPSPPTHHTDDGDRHSLLSSTPVGKIDTARSSLSTLVGQIYLQESRTVTPDDTPDLLQDAMSPSDSLSSLTSHLNPFTITDSSPSSSRESSLLLPDIPDILVHRPATLPRRSSGSVIHSQPALAVETTVTHTLSTSGRRMPQSSSALTAHIQYRSVRRCSGDLFEHLTFKPRLSEQECKHIFKQVLCAVMYLADNNIVHRDIKIENIIIDDTQQVKLIDFGNASYLPNSKSDYFTNFYGTLHVAAPEILNKVPYHGMPQEVWSLGVLLYTLAFGKRPFDSLQDISHGRFTIPSRMIRSSTDPMAFNPYTDSMIQPKEEMDMHEVQTSNELKDLLERIFEVNVDRRITCLEISQHPWLLNRIP